ncbi:MAG: RNA-binding S4 domain-containing protein [Steroidobacteraceae bacterium]
MDGTLETRHRLDKWLWCARFYRSRALATEAVQGGKVKLNDARVKPAHAVGIGDRLTITREAETLEVQVLTLPERRGPASLAQAAYMQTPESRERAARNHEQHRLAALSRPRPEGRPDKRERRRLERLLRRQT